MVPRCISTHGKRRGTRRTLDSADRRESKPGQRRSKTGTKPVQHSGRHGVHVAVQATESKVHAPNLFAMPATTLKKTISNEQLRGFPMMNVKDIRRHLPPLPATPKGRIKRPRGGIRSTRRENKDEFEKELEEQLTLSRRRHAPRSRKYNFRGCTNK